MRRAREFILPLISLLMITACGGGGGSSKSQAEQGTSSGSSSIDITYDSDLTPKERQALNSSTKALASYQIDGSKIKYFSQIFGGNQSANVVNYVETRVNYALSAETNYPDRLVVQSSSSLRNLQAFAFNPSVDIWYEAKASSPDTIKLRINDNLIDITSSRIGVMQFGDLYVSSPSSLQAATIVHEARHSDCTGGALASDIERHRQGLPAENKKCGHLHGMCPPGHIYEGQVACDLLPWGAYIMDAIYSAAIVETCSSCSETDKQAAEANAMDALERPAYSVEDLFNGKLGSPDMSNSTQVR